MAKTLRDYITESEAWVDQPAVGDDFAITIREECLVESHIVDVVEDGVILAADDRMIEILESYGLLEGEQLDELSLKTLDSYATKAGLSNAARRAGMALAQQKHDDSVIAKHIKPRPKFSDAEERKMQRRGEFVGKAIDRLRSGVQEASTDDSDRMLEILESYGLLENQDPYRREVSPPSAEEFEEGIGSWFMNRGTKKFVDLLDSGRSPSEIASYILDLDPSKQQDLRNAFAQYLQNNQHPQLKKLLGMISEDQGMAEGPVEAYGVAGMKSRPWRRVFANQAAFDRWLAKNEGNVEVHGVRAADSGASAGAVKGVAEGSQELRRIQELAGLPLATQAPAAMPAVNEGGLKRSVDNLYYDFREKVTLPPDVDDDTYLAAVADFLRSEGIDPEYHEDIGELFIDMRDHAEDDDHDYANAIDAEQYDDEDTMEAKYQGREVPLGKPFLTPNGPKKRSVYVKNPKGNVVKVNFGDKKLRIKKSNPKRRKSFRARHNCANPGPRHKARFWSCRAW